MARVVINMPDEELYKIEHDRVITDEQRAMLFSAITKGIVLSEGLGDLIDSSELLKNLRIGCANCEDKNTNWCKQLCPHIDLEYLVENAPTVIKADKEAENGKS